MNVGSLFSGIGGIDLGLERAGMRVVWQCESDPYCRAVLRKHWPDVPCWQRVEDVPDPDRIEHEGPPPENGRKAGPRLPDPADVDIVCGGFPCQPFSYAGARRGVADDRWLWPEFERVVRLLRPRYVLVENVPGLLTAGMGDVLGGLASLGYDTEWDCVPAVAVGAPHRRDRVWIVAYPGSPRRRQNTGGASSDEGADAGWPAQDDHELDGDGQGDRARPVAHPNCEGQPRRTIDAKPRQGVVVQDSDGGTVQPRRIWGRAPQADSTGWWAAEPDVGRVAHGVPSRLDRLSALGNAVVPQVAEWIGRRIIEADAGSR